LGGNTNIGGEGTREGLRKKGLSFLGGEKGEGEIEGRRLKGLMSSYLLTS